MSKVYIDDSVFTDIADAIRDRNGETATYKPREMDEAIKDLHNVRVKKWERPSDWPDYSKVDLTNQEVIYLTYDCTDTYDPKPISIRVYGAYSVVRGQINNGIFTAASAVTNVASGGIFREMLPTDEGDYVVYKVTPQEDAVITRFAFARWDDLESSKGYYQSWMQPCVERYCRIPSWIGTGNRTVDQYTWSTRYLIADTIKDASPNSLINAYNDGGVVLKKVDMFECSFANVTTLETAFYAQHNLSEIYFPSDLSNKCTKINGTFRQCYSLCFLNLSGWDTSGVINIGSIFQDCSHLVEIKGIESWDVSNVININNAFQSCRILRKLDLSNWHTGKILSLSSTFAECQCLQELDVSGFDTSDCTYLGGCFYECFNLSVLDLSNWIVTNKCTVTSNVFAYCRHLTKIIRTTWDTSNSTTFEGMFRECRNLTEIDVSDFDFSKATTIRYMFMQCHSLRKIKANINLTKVTNRTNVTDFLEGCMNLSDISELNITNSTYMPDFSYNYVLQELTVPSSVTGIYDSTLRDIQHLQLLDFRNHTSIPTLNAAADITNGMNSLLKIVVPDDLYDTWSTATNWNNGTIRSCILSATEYNNYIDPSVTLTDIDLSQCDWVKNNNANQNAAVGSAYSSVIYGSGNRISSGLIDVPSGRIFYISVNSGYGVHCFLFNEDGYLKRYKTDIKTWHFIHPTTDSTATQIGLVVYKVDGTLLDPADWADSGIKISYFVGR